MTIPADLRDDLLAQARALLVGQPRTIKLRDHAANTSCGRFCLEVHLLGGLNRQTYTGADVMWGPTAAGSLFGMWELHAHRYHRLTGSFPDVEGGVFTVDLSDALK
jgi:hypothetical protein